MQLGSHVCCLVCLVFALQVVLGSDAFIYVLLGSMSLYPRQPYCPRRFGLHSLIEVFPQIAVADEFPRFGRFLSVPDELDVLIRRVYERLTVRSKMDGTIGADANDTRSKLSSSGTPCVSFYLGIESESSVALFFDSHLKFCGAKGFWAMCFVKVMEQDEIRTASL